MYYVGKKSCMSVQLRIIQTRDDGLTSFNLEPIINTGTRLLPTAISIPFINNNPVVSLFDSLTTSMNDVYISDNQFLQPSNALYRIMNETKEEQIIDSTNPITLMNSYVVGTATSPYAPETAKILTKIGATNNPQLPQTAPIGVITPRM